MALIRQPYQELFQQAVLAIPGSLYSQGQKLAWISRANDLNWEERLGRQILFERKENGRTMAFATLDSDTLDFLFVAPEFWRKGLATSLIQEAEAYARSHGFSELKTEASLVLFPLCIREGFQVIEKEFVSIGHEKLPRFKMSKPLTDHRHRSNVLWNSERLFLRELLPIDAQFAYELNLDPEVIRYTGDEPFASVEESLHFHKNYDPYTKTGFGRWAMIRKDDGAWIGWCGLKRHDDGQVDLGYRMHQKYWNQGYATEAARLCMELAKNNYRLDELILQVARDNHASRRVAEKLGFILQDGPAPSPKCDVHYRKKLRE